MKDNSRQIAVLLQDVEYFRRMAAAHLRSADSHRASAVQYEEMRADYERQEQETLASIERLQQESAK